MLGYNYYISKDGFGYSTKSEKELNKEKEFKKKIELQNIKNVKFSNKNFFRGK